MPSVHLRNPAFITPAPTDLLPIARFGCIIRTALADLLRASSSAGFQHLSKPIGATLPNWGMWSLLNQEFHMQVFQQNAQSIQAAAYTYTGADNGDPAYAVTLPNGESGSWNISLNLTDRWGELNVYMATAKAMKPLVDQPELYERLINQQWDEMTFVVHMDGQYGLLFEQEFATKESEVNLIQPTDSCYEQEMARLMSEADLKPVLLERLQPLVAKYPSVQFCLPPKEEMCEERLGIWAFVADGLLDDATREQLGRDILAI